MPKERHVSPEDTPNQPTKLSAKNWVEINGDVRGIYTDIHAW